MPADTNPTTPNNLYLNMSIAYQDKMGPDPRATLKRFAGRLSFLEWTTFIPLVAASDENWEGKLSAEVIADLYYKTKPRQIQKALEGLVDKEFIVMQESGDGFRYSILERRQ